MNAKSDPRWAAGEALPGIVTIGDPLLRREARRVDKPADVKELAEAMVKKLRELNGAGLAANQVGENLALVVVEVRKTDVFPDRPESPLYVMINPKIVSADAELVDEWEGCFSVPGLMGIISRPKTVRVEFTTPDGIEQVETFDGYVGRVVQHELDHLTGADFLDRMTSMESLSTVENWLKYQRSSR